ncbi:glycosyltransferase [Pseudobutyrivibrio xylanivorans]|uniref:Glycosyl transferase family 2 n=1 Tax=Pseudobutyrivibrio xylanivorans TaxID=185007 RepID=A0A1G5S4Z3_PSEXY|nr:glycosyltransferase [Pseudobutyrivibrio xylanivorans]SCZ81238.1 Glycosyl transferase family 2 [Pseudobutyrivibrio xylanivorans]
MIDFRVIYLPQNVGHGEARRLCLNECRYPLVALMDADDISCFYRFEKQLEVFDAKPYLSVVGGQIIEFDNDSKQYTGIRHVPLNHSEIKKYMKKRCPMNQVSVMFKVNDVIDAGGYIDWYCEEDYYLWIRMIEKGFLFENIPDITVKVRTGEAMSSRRGGWKYFSSEMRLQKYMLEEKIISKIRYIFNVLIRFFGEVLVGTSLRKKLFRFMRKSVSKDLVTNLDSNMAPTYKKNSHSESFSVSMCVYKGDNPEWFDLALSSIINQSIQPREIVVVADGPLTDSLEAVVKKYKDICVSLNVE